MTDIEIQRQSDDYWTRFAIIFVIEGFLIGSLVLIVFGGGK